MAEQIQAFQTIFLLLIEYSVFVLGTGGFVLRKRILGKGFINGLLISLVMGNVLCINIVFVSYALRCYKQWGLFLLWILLILWSWLWPIRKEIQNKIENSIEVFRKITDGEYGIKLILNNIVCKAKSFARRITGNFFKKWFFPHLLEIIFVTGIMIFNIWYNSYHAIHFGGIGVPDVSVHTEWIQKMREGNIFGNGIYPFGFHCIIYLMITFFQNELIPVMTFFALTQDFWIFLLFYFLMRKVFRFPGTAVMGFFVFSVLEVIGNFRYQFTLPQEYGMIGLYPAVLFLWMYLEKKKQDIREEKIKPVQGDSLEARKLVRRLNRKMRMKEKGVNEYAWYFGFSVALTFMCHFYITIACFFLCVGLAVFYFDVIFQKKCLGPLIISVLLCMLMALAPMIGWYATGKPLEGSMNWALGVISGEEVDENGIKQQETAANTDINLEDAINKENTENHKINSEKEKKELTEEEKFWVELKTKSFVGKIYDIIKKICTEIMERENGLYFFFSILTAVTYSCLLLIFKSRRAQARMILGLSAYLFMLLILSRAIWFGLPNLMDAGRTSIFIDYIAGFFFACPLEAVTGWFSTLKWFRLIIGLGIYAFNGVLVVQTAEGNHVKSLSSYNMMQYKPALDLTEEIINEYEDNTWTIVSPVDELPFLRLNGYHYEWLEFLAKQAKYKEKKSLYIPTKYVFFYIEKKPLQYAKAIWMEAGKPKLESVNTKDADTIFNEKEDFSSELYNSHRNIIQSKAYYWAKTYASYFPREMTVYYEDEDFICYRLVQDPYRLNNLVVDFGYNIGIYRMEEEANE